MGAVRVTLGGLPVQCRSQAQSHTLNQSSGMIFDPPTLSLVLHTVQAGGVW